MRPLVFLILAGLLASCSPTFSARVDDFSVPIGNTLATVCWTRVDASGAPSVRAATYRGQAIYGGSLTLTERVEVQFYGRAQAPVASCTSRDSSDLQLSDVLELNQLTAQPVEVGGGAYGAELASLVNEGVFWLGASVAGNAGAGEELRFEDGRIEVTF